MRAYPRASAVMIAALLLAGVAEGVGLSTLLPLLTVALETSTGGAAGEAQGLVVDALSALGLSPGIGVLLSVIVLGMAMRGALVLLAKRQAGYTVAHVTTDLRLSVIRAVLAARWAYHLRQPAGALANAMGTEAARAAAGYRSGADMVAISIQAVVYAAVALLVSWQATVLALAAGLLILYVLNRLVRISRRAGAKQTRLLKSLLARTVDSLRAVKLLKAMGCEALADRLLRDDANRLNRALRRQALSEAALHSLQEPILAAFVAFGLYFALVHWQMPLASVLTLVFLLTRVVGHLNRIQRQYQRLATCESAYWSLQSTVEEARRQAEAPAGGRAPSLERGIEMVDVGFAYGDEATLRGLSLAIPAGRFSALVGASGAGKTTLVDLLIGLMSPQSGEIRADGVPLEMLDRRRWCRMIGYVPQEPLLLHDTVLRNVTLDDPAISRDDAVWALRAAGVWDTIEALPEGLETNVGQAGARFSGGQQQRIAIARALARRPRLLILDEATSALDADTEAAVCASLAALHGHITVVAVSHRAALVDVAERVYRLEEGRAVLVKDAAPTQAAASRAANA